MPTTVTEDQISAEEVAKESLAPAPFLPTEPTSAPEAPEAPESPEASESSAESEAEPQAEEIQSLRDAATAAGYDLSTYEDDHTALSHLIQQARQAEQANQQLQQYQQQVFSQQQSQPLPEPQAAEEPPLWNPPEFNATWLTQVRADEQGNLMPINGGTPETVAKVRKWAEYRQEQQDKFWQNPFSYLQPFVDKVVKENVGHQFQQSEEQVTARKLIDDNAEWLFTDQSRMQFSEEGQLFNQAIQELPTANVQQQYNHGMMRVQNARLQKQLDALQSQTTANQTHEAKKQQAVQNAATAANLSGTIDNGSQEQNPNLSLEERMAAALKRAGVTDKDISGYS